MTRYVEDELLFPPKKPSARVDFRIPFINGGRAKVNTNPPATTAPWLWDINDIVLWDTSDEMDYGTP